MAQLILLQNHLCDILGLMQGVLRLCAVKKGCFEITMQAPAHIQKIIFPLSSHQETELCNLKIVRLTCGNYEFKVNEITLLL